MGPFRYDAAAREKPTLALLSDAYCLYAVRCTACQLGSLPLFSCGGGASRLFCRAPSFASPHLPPPSPQSEAYLLSWALGKMQQACSQALEGRRWAGGAALLTPVLVEALLGPGRRFGSQAAVKEAALALVCRVRGALQA